MLDFASAPTVTVAALDHGSGCHSVQASLAVHGGERRVGGEGSGGGVEQSKGRGGFYRLTAGVPWAWVHGGSRARAGSPLASREVP